MNFVFRLVKIFHIKKCYNFMTEYFFIVREYKICFIFEKTITIGYFLLCLLEIPNYKNV